MDYTGYIVDTAKKILAIDSPTGFTQKAADFVLDELKAMGYSPIETTKGGVFCDLGGKCKDNSLFLMAHMDTLGCVVHEIKANGRLKLTNVGGLNAQSIIGENCKIYTRFNGVYEGTFNLCNGSSHVNDDFNGAKRDYNNMEVILDEMVFTKADTEALGIMNGDFVCFDPRTTVTEKGYIKSRFLDDKLSVSILLGYAKYLSDNKIVPERNIYMHITCYEEVGHGGSASVPSDVKEVLAVDMGCIGDGLTCKEHQVSICAKDSGGPYNYDMTTKLIKAAKENDIDFAVDIYPHYGSDAGAVLKAGNDVKHALIGPGVYVSHGYERSHILGAENTFKLIKAYTGC